jgi:hypothetical protein
MRKQILITAIGIAGLSQVSAVNAQSLVQSGSYGADNYEVYSDAGVTWSAAEAFAASKGGYLATVTSAGEDNFLAQLDPSGEYWLGGFQNPITTTDPTLGWTWLHGDGTFPGANGGSVFTSWAPGEPNDDEGPGSEQYLAIGLEGAGNWNDEGDLDEISGFVVEYSPKTYSAVPDNGSLLIPLGMAFVGLAVVQRRTAKTV